MKLELNEKRVELEVERGGERVGTVSFSPEDVGFASRYYAMMEGLSEREKAFQEPENPGERLRQAENLCLWLRAELDVLFGEGTSQTLFGDSLNLNLLRQFFEGLAPAVRQARETCMAEYLEETE